MTVKSFIVQTPGVNVAKHFFFLSNAQENSGGVLVPGNLFQP
jgi:hypothetical protein